MNKTAKFIKTLDDWRSSAKLFELSEPMEYELLDSNERRKTSFVIVSAVIAMFTGAETYIFPATKDGEAINHLEMYGSFRGELDHIQALNNAGYTVEGEIDYV